MRHRIFIFFAVICSLIPFNCYAGYFSYATYDLDSKITQFPLGYSFNMKDGLMIDNKNEMTRLKKCEQADEFFCISGELFTFYVPKALFKVSDSWKCEGTQYTVKRNLDIRFMGTVMSVFLIDVHELGGYKTQYFYSLKRGLIAFRESKEGNDSGTIYWLQEKVGFGALTN